MVFSLGLPEHDCFFISDGSMPGAHWARHCPALTVVSAKGVGRSREMLHSRNGKAEAGRGPFGREVARAGLTLVGLPIERRVGE